MGLTTLSLGTTLAALVCAVSAQSGCAQQYGQCGGSTGYTGATCCMSPYVCVEQNAYYSQCSTSSMTSSGSEECTSLPNVTVTVTMTGPSPAASTATVAERGSASAYGQRGGIGFTGSTTCISGYVCTDLGNAYYKQCLPGTANGGSVTTTKASVSSSTQTKASSTNKGASSSSVTASTKSMPSPSSATGGMSSSASSTPLKSTASSSSSAAAPAQTPGGGASTGFLGGVNLAGFDFGIDVWGDSGTYVVPPVSQIAHFAAEGVNVFRVPFGWQYMENTPGGGLNADFFAKYDGFVKQVLAASTAPYVILDMHNYARWNGKVIGADGPTATQFAAAWGALATKYAGNSKIMFGLMNEPHDLEIESFVPSLQAAVTAIRNAGATTQYILLPGSTWTHASAFISTNEGPLSKITDKSGNTDLLVFDLHEYLDSDESGTQTTCTEDRVNDTFVPVAAALRSSKRKAILTEIGGSSDPSCQKYLKSALASIKSNSDVYLGFVTWAAGAFDTSYPLSLTPNGDTDAVLWTAAVKPNLPGTMAKRFHREVKLAKQRLLH